MSEAGMYVCMSDGGAGWVRLVYCHIPCIGVPVPYPLHVSSDEATFPTWIAQLSLAAVCLEGGLFALGAGRCSRPSWG